MTIENDDPTHSVYSASSYKESQPCNSHGVTRNSKDKSGTPVESHNETTTEESKSTEPPATQTSHHMEGDNPEELKASPEESSEPGAFSSASSEETISKAVAYPTSLTISEKESEDFQAASTPIVRPGFKPKARMFRPKAASAGPTSQFIMDVPEMFGVGADGSMMEVFNKIEIKD